MLRTFAPSLCIIRSNHPKRHMGIMLPKPNNDIAMALQHAIPALGLTPSLAIASKCFPRLATSVDVRTS